ncbi:MAG TPA: DnaJ domain-containing protein [Xenococcaceae cyanobacterium]
MAFAIKHGLFKLNITDHHAILGVPLNADPKEIRLKYLKIAHKLHPDTCKVDKNQKKLANKFLSRLVNPAYEYLSKKNFYAEHQLILTQIGQQLAKKSHKITLASESARKLAQAGDKFELVYLKLLNSLVQEQYESLNSALDKIAIISELNLVYLMLQQSREVDLSQPEMTAKSASASATAKPTVTKPPATPTPKPPEPPSPELRVASYVRRAKEYMGKGNLIQAIAELKDALKIDPNNAKVHGLLGKIYLRQEQLTMAKIHLKKAEQANPREPIVIEGKKELDKILNQKNNHSKSSKNTSTSSNKSTNSGIFGSLFGTKKK